MCDHTGEYDIRTIVNSGHFLDRVYHCRECWANMKVDVLPPYLLARMYGFPMRGDLPQDPLPPVDFCVVFSGVLALPLARLFFWSLEQCAATLEGVTFHLVNIDVPGRDFDQIEDMVPEVHCYRRPPVPERLLARGSNRLGIDAEWSSNWAVEHCGGERFVVLSHFDIFFVRDFLTLLRSRVTPRTGQLGHHRPIILLNRDVFHQSIFKFRSEGPFRGVMRTDDSKGFFIYHPDDPRAAGDYIQTGFDTGELMELELRVLGWEVDPLIAECEQSLYHFTGGGRVLDGPELVSLKRRVKMFTEEYGVPERFTIGGGR